MKFRGIVMSSVNFELVGLVMKLLGFSCRTVNRRSPN